jgi:tetratricopeptide (TPR) repeat protein
VLVLNQKLGVDPLTFFANPVYGWVLNALATLTGNSIYVLNLFSAVCAASVLTLVFLIVYRLSHRFNHDHVLPAATLHRIQIAAGLIAALYLLATPPFWLAATRAHPLPFDLLLLLTPFYLALSYSRKSSPLRIRFAALLYGVAIFEFNTAALLAPVFIIYTLVSLWRAESFNARSLGACAVFGLAGLSLYLVQAGLYQASPEYAWREFDSYFRVLWYIWLEQYAGLTRTLPRVGWLTLFLVAALPLFLSLGMRLPGSTHRNRGALVGTSMLHLLLAGLAILLLLDFPLAPVALTGTDRLFVTPYLLIALWVGCVTAFWLVLFYREKRLESPGLRNARRLAGHAILVLVPLYLVGILTLRTLPGAHNPADPLIHRAAVEIADLLGDRPWLISNTPLDEQIELELFRRGNHATVLRLAYGRSPAHMKYVANLFSDRPRLESLARVGLAPMMEEWLRDATNAVTTIAITHVPDMWQAAGIEGIPNRLIFDGILPGNAPDPVALFAAHQAFWNGLGADLVAVEPDPATVSGRMLAWLRVHASKIANNLGVYLEDANRDDDALASYRAARTLAPENLSALMNLHVITARLQLPEHEAIDTELTAATEDLIGKVQTWSLAQLYGFVRVPELFANRGLAFAMSGKSQLAISDMKRALALNEGNPQLQLALAGLYFASEQDIESRAYYEDVLARNPDSPQALLGLTRVSVRAGEFEEARRHLARLKELGAPPLALKLEEAVLESLAGAPARAMRLINEVVTAQPENLQAWAALAVAAAQLNDNEATERALTKLRGAKMLAPGIQLVLAQSALNQNDHDTARGHLAELLRRQPGNIAALELLLRIELAEGNRDEAHRVVERILNHDPRNAFANYMLGIHHYLNQEFALAETAFRASLATAVSADALNDLAYVLFIQNRSAEAEPFVRQAIQINDRNGMAWDTLGVILMKLGQLEEAEEALTTSLGLRPNNASVLLSLARLHESQGRTDEALTITRDITARQNELSPQAQSELRNLLSRLQSTR